MAEAEDIGPSLSDLIRDLASTRTDSVPVRKRNEVIDTVTKSLASSSTDRRTLANLGGT
jgi:hypothetical protein